MNKLSGDVVKAEQVYLQDHLNNSIYLSSKECKMADEFILAFKNYDLELLEDTKNDQNLNYVDREIQNLARKLNFKAKKNKVVGVGGGGGGRGGSAKLVAKVSSDTSAPIPPFPSAEKVKFALKPPPTSDKDGDGAAVVSAANGINDMMKKEEEVASSSSLPPRLPAQNQQHVSMEQEEDDAEDEIDLT
jgi:hypothetical protein